MSEENKVLDKPADPGTDAPQDNQGQPAPQGDSLAPEIQAEHAALKKLSTDDLIDIIRETRSEAKNRRLKTRELEERMAEIEREKQAAEEAALKENKEYETLYNKLKEQTADYEDLREFKGNYLETCKQEVGELQKGLTKAESEVFELSAKNMSYSDQLVLIKKMLTSRQTSTVIDKTQSTGRSPDKPEPDTGPKMPFTGGGGVMGKVSELLAKGRSHN